MTRYGEDEAPESQHSGPVQENTRRWVDTEMVERVTKVEGELRNINREVADMDRSVKRVHERLDDVVKEMKELTDTVHGHGQGLDEQVKSALFAHIAQEEMLAQARARAVDARFDALENSLQTVTDAGESRLDTMQKGFDALHDATKEIRSSAIKLGLGLLGVAGTVVVSIISWAIAHHDQINAIMDRMGR